MALSHRGDHRDRDDVRYRAVPTQSLSYPHGHRVMVPLHPLPLVGKGGSGPLPDATRDRSNGPGSEAQGDCGNRPAPIPRSLKGRMIAWAYRCIGEDHTTAAALARATEVGINEMMPEFRRPPRVDLVNLLEDGPDD
jgi:hypothetical protein